MFKISANASTNIAQAILMRHSRIESLFEAYKVQLSESAAPHPLDFALAYRFFTEAHECTGDVDVGLVAYQYARPYFFGVPGYSVMSSATVGIALERLVKYYPLIADSSLLSLDEQNGTLVISVHANGLSGTQVPRYIIDAAAAAILGVIHWLGHLVNIQPCRVELPYSEPADTKNLQQLLGSHITFGASHLSLSFNSDIKNAPVFTANSAFEDIHCRYADALLEERINGSLVEKVRSAFSAGVAEGKLPSLQEVAFTLRMSMRTLQKSLEREGVTFSELQEDLRKEIASNLLSISTLSLKKISSILGFCQASSLHKACRRWFGSSPGQLRAGKSKHLQAC
ncbi:AraC family transcriptional regulator [Pseudomonas asplenii]|uniref:AraC family transcriptional regulator n=1 Tax=Pseudomonas asplenii TaxID=53407 RepID=UPI002233EAC7|nr:AraC family transcriptional regulator [Pseudomonas asplenii]UZE28973.1 AraC family transcriptional regulator [Pseudomonas asplenii]